MQTEWVQLKFKHWASSDRPGLKAVLLDGDNEQPLYEFICVFLLQTLEAYEKKKLYFPGGILVTFLCEVSLVSWEET